MILQSFYILDLCETILSKFVLFECKLLIDLAVRVGGEERDKDKRTILNFADVCMDVETWSYNC